MFFLLAFACSTAPVTPYTPEECALARSFEETCYHLNYQDRLDENYNSFDFSKDEDLYTLIERRNTLAVSPDRHWWCSDPSSYNDYHYVATFSPDLESCVTASP
jgi:hypothetical protein